MKLPYICWTVDSPVMELYSDSYSNEWNRIFLFDSMQYQDFAPYNPAHTFFLPLATNVKRWDSVLADSNPDSYKSDIFVGIYVIIFIIDLCMVCIIEKYMNRDAIAVQLKN